MTTSEKCLNFQKGRPNPRISAHFDNKRKESHVETPDASVWSLGQESSGMSKGFFLADDLVDVAKRECETCMQVSMRYLHLKVKDGSQVR